jgi:hypothetical protein
LGELLGIDGDPLWRVTAKQDHGCADPVTCCGGKALSQVMDGQRSLVALYHIVLFLLVSLIHIISVEDG